MRTSARQPDTDHSQPKDIITKPKPLLITLAAVSALAASAANAAQVVVTTGASYDALAALYQKETGVAVETSFGGNIGQMLAPVKHGSGVNVVISDEASLEKFHDALAPDARRLGDTPLVVRPLQAAFASPRLIELEEAARIHGAGRRDVFLRITLPLVRPSLAAALLLGCARVSGEVGITMMLGGNISERTNTLSLEIFNAVSRADFDAANALCLLLSLFAAVIFLAAELLIRRSPRL